MTLEGSIQKSKRVLLPILFSSIVLVFLSLNGTLNSGYHLVDDHEIICIHNELQTDSFITVLKRWVNNDLKNRFRPLYYTHKVITTGFFGTNFLAISIYTGILGTITFLSLFLGLKRLNFNFLECIIFIIITFFGPQFSIWWRLGPNETLGITLLSISFLFMSKCIKRKYYFLNDVLFVLFLILSTLCKESFLIVVPGFILFKFVYEKVSLKISLIESLRRNVLSFIPLAIIIIEVYIILRYVGLDKTEYAGIDLHIKDTMNGIINILLINLKEPYLLIFEWAIIIILLQKLIFNNPRFKQLILPLIFSILIVTPNLILYAKSGMWERYFLPSSFGLAFLLISIIKEYGHGLKLIKIIMLIIVLNEYIPITKSMILDAQSYASEGRMVNSLVSSTLGHHTDKSKALIAVDPVKHYEKSYALKVYFGIEENIELYGYAFEDESLNEEFRDSRIKGWYDYFRNRTFDDLLGKPDEIIFLDKKLIDKFFNICMLNQNKYVNIIPENELFALLVLDKE
ncbi:MAG: hypothetical protein K8R35_01195 [Bacteroidales bacterium]|nr:hypothetical protein [Bacteroidales bacterium]